ncbi:MAG: isoleucine--tRNA ligase [Clostridia bacterium]|nr:isoleucine--tRNA ligase [Clostridia bacterium]
MYKSVDSKLDFIKNEKEVLNFWKENNIFKKSLNKNEGNQIFSFYEGPPTANGLPHIGHPLTRAMKDIIPRYKTMKGFYVPRKAGWDTHGLPVEVEVEKQLGLNGKQDIENFGVEKFIELCKQSVWKYKGMWEEITERFGYWVDMEDPYITYDNKYIESIFWALKEMDKKGLIYKGHKIVPYCPRCGTSLSKMEVEQNYKVLKEKSIFVKMKSLEEDNTYFLVWTTTPWTLPSNIAICMNPNEVYVKIEYEGVNYIMLKNLVSKLFEDGTYTEVYSKTGKEFEYQKYEPLFDYVKDTVKNGYFVTVDDYVTVEDGTGIVHIAPAFGEDDYKVGKNYDLTFIQLIDDAGKFTQEATDFVGMGAKEADKFVIEKLENENKMFKVLLFEHSYPHCWRCNTPLLYYGKSTWFVKTTEVKDLMVENNNSVYWIPDTIKGGRMGNFLANNIDWGISRNRYWGTPLPFWVCECGHIHVVGSVEELKKLSGVEGDLDLHKPTLDKITFPCEKCGKMMQRTPEVMDCWFDSGSMPFAQYHYPFENKELFEKTFPSDFICEGIDQTRGWFYVLIAINTILFGKSPYKSCTALGLINDRFGQKMSKSKGNGIDPWDILNKEGSDALRWYFYYSCNPGQSMSFNEDNLIELQRKFMGTLWNIYAFYVLYAEIDQFDPTKYDLKDCKLSFFDKWLLSEYNALVKKVTECLEKYDMLTPARIITDFVDTLSNWYVRRSRERFWGSEQTDDKISAYKTLYEVLVGTIKLVAPFVPFISEKIYQNLVRSVDANAPESVHLCSYPECDESMIDGKLNEGMDKVLKIVVLGRASRSNCGVKNRQPLSKAIVCTANKLELEEELQNLIKDELNVEDLVILHDASDYVSYEIKPQLKTIGPKYGKLLGKIKEFLANVEPVSTVKNVRNGENLKFEVDGTQVELSEEDLLISVKNREGYSSESDGEITLVLDTNLTQELLEKGFVREVVSKVQNLRKESGFEVVNHIVISFNCDDETKVVIENYKNVIQKDTLCDEVNFDGKGDFVTQLENNGKTIEIYIKKV